MSTLTETSYLMAREREETKEKNQGGENRVEKAHGNKSSKREGK